jgi:hypothetical protein
LSGRSPQAADERSEQAHQDQQQHDGRGDDGDLVLAKALERDARRGLAGDLLVDRLAGGKLVIELLQVRSSH